MKKAWIFFLFLFSAPLAWAESSSHDHHGHGAQAMPMVIETTGEVRGLTAKSGQIKLRHEAIPALGWPAMVMSFKAQDRKLLNGLKVGDAVAFSFVSGEAGHVVTAIRKQGQ